MDYKLTPIKLACKEESVDFDWDGTFADLTRGFTEEFTEVECPKTLTLLDSNTECRRAASRVFRLCLRDGPFYEGHYDFVMKDDASVVDAEKAYSQRASMSA